MAQHAALTYDMDRYASSAVGVILRLVRERVLERTLAWSGVDRGPR
jgi:hypothetical protein